MQQSIVTFYCFVVQTLLSTVSVRQSSNILLLCRTDTAQYSVCTTKQ